MVTSFLCIYLEQKIEGKKERQWIIASICIPLQCMQIKFRNIGFKRTQASSLFSWGRLRRPQEIFKGTARWELSASSGPGSPPHGGGRWGHRQNLKEQFSGKYRQPDQGCSLFSRGKLRIPQPIFKGTVQLNRASAVAIPPKGDCKKSLKGL